MQVVVLVGSFLFLGSLTPSYCSHYEAWNVFDVFFSQLVVLVGTTLTELLFPPQRVVLVIQRGQGRNWLHANCLVVPFWKWCTYLHHITSQMFWTFLCFIEIPLLLQSNWIAAAILCLKCLTAFHVSLSSLQHVNISLHIASLYTSHYCPSCSVNIFQTIFSNISWTLAFTALVKETIAGQKNHNHKLFVFTLTSVCERNNDRITSGDK